MKRGGGVLQFGKRKVNGDNQLSWYEAVYSKVLESVQNGDNLRGALFWRWAEDGGTDSTTVYTGDATFQYAPFTLCNIPRCRVLRCSVEVMRIIDQVGVLALFDAGSLCAV